MGTKRNFAWGNGRMMQCADDFFFELCTQNLYGFVNQCHPDTFTLKI